MQYLQEIPTGHDGNGFVTLGGKVLPVFRIAKISGTISGVVESKRFLNERMTQHMMRGMEGSGSLSYYVCSSTFIQMMKQYQETGVYPEITIQYFVESSAGKNEVLLRRVVLKDIALGSLDDDSDQVMAYTTRFTFDDFEQISGFAE